MSGGTGEVTGALARLRGDAAARNHDARTIAALTTNPGCARRGLMDAAGVDKQGVAAALGHPMPVGQSAFAITRGNAFEARVKADGCAELLTLLRERLGLPVPEVALHDLGAVGGNDTREVRYARTRQLVQRVLDGGDGTLFDHPLLRLDVAGQDAYLEPDVIAFRVGGRFHVVEIKSFAIVDGQAEADKVSAAARQSAVYVLALRRLLTELGADPVAGVAHDVILVCPEDFSNRPTAAFVDVRKQLAVIERQLSRLTRVEDLIALVPDGLTFAYAEEAGSRLADAVSAVPARYAPECMASCELARFCRAEAGACGSTDVLGRTLRDEVGGVAAIPDALALADGSRTPEPGEEDIARRLRTAFELRREALGGAVPSEGAA